MSDTVYDRSAACSSDFAIGQSELHEAYLADPLFALCVFEEDVKPNRLRLLDPVAW